MAGCSEPADPAPSPSGDRNITDNFYDSAGHESLRFRRHGRDRRWSTPPAHGRDAAVPRRRADPADRGQLGRGHRGFHAPGVERRPVRRRRCGGNLITFVERSGPHRSLAGGKGRCLVSYFVASSKWALMSISAICLGRTRVSVCSATWHDGGWRDGAPPQPVRGEVVGATRDRRADPARSGPPGGTGCDRSPLPAPTPSAGPERQHDKNPPESFNLPMPVADPRLTDLVHPARLSRPDHKIHTHPE
jgi:hypothetical protein